MLSDTLLFLFSLTKLLVFEHPIPGTFREVFRYPVYDKAAETKKDMVFYRHVRMSEMLAKPSTAAGRDII